MEDENPRLVVSKNQLMPEYCAGLSQMNKDIIKPRINEVLEKLNLTEEKNKLYRKLSGGMKRRLGIAQAMLHDPPVLILDEPTVGLDVEEKYKLRELIKILSENKIIIVSTHIMEDIESICNNIGILHRGEVKYIGTIENLKVTMNAETLESAYLNIIQEGQ